MTDRGLAQGVVLVLSGITIIAVIDNLVRLIAPHAGLWQFHMTRSLMALPVLVAALWLLGAGIRPIRPGRVFLRSACNAAAMLLYFGALPMMPIAEVGAALFTAPIWVLIFSVVFFGHRIGPWRLAAVGIGFLGVVVMLAPDPANLSAVTLMPVAAGALLGLANLLTREWCRDEPVGALLAVFFLCLGVAGAVVLGVLSWLRPPVEAAPFLLSGWTSPTMPFLFWTAVQAIFSLIAVALLQKGYQSGDTSYLAVFEYSFLITASLTAFVLFGETVGPRAVLGMAMIAAAGVIIVIRGRAAASAAPPRV